MMLGVVWKFFTCGCTGARVEKGQGETKRGSRMKHGRAGREKNG